MKQLNFGSTNGVPNDPNKTVVHCPTQELAQKVLRISDRLWDGSEIKMHDNDEWEYYRKETCYDLNNGLFSNKNWYVGGGYTILPAEEFIRLNTEVENPFIPFAKDDRVFNYHKGWGSVMAISEPPKLLCQVDFDSGECRWMDVGELSFTPYTLQGFSQERPKPEIKKGQLIYVRTNGAWEMRFFSNWDDGMPSCYDDQKKEGSTYTWPEYSLTNPLEEE